MSGQHKGLQHNGSNVESKEGERGLLCCNKAIVRSPSLEFKSNSPFVSEEMKIDYLAELIVDMYLEQKRYGNRKQEKSCDILQGFDQGTS